jgi:hypothetical protein
MRTHQKKYKTPNINSQIIFPLLHKAKTINLKKKHEAINNVARREEDVRSKWAIL